MENGVEQKQVSVSLDEDDKVLYIDEKYASVRKKDKRIAVFKEDELLFEVPVFKISEIWCMGRVGFTADVMDLIFDEEIRVNYFNWRGEFICDLEPALSKNSLLREKQVIASVNNKELSLTLAKAFIMGKILNMRAMLMRHSRNHAEIGEKSIQELANYVEKVNSCAEEESLLGIEGMATRIYFENFSVMIRNDDPAFKFTKRTKRPPEDPVNALLSFGYTCLAGTEVAICHAVGLDPYMGFLHKERYSKPCLALDLMEEFRSAVIDAVVLTLINKQIIKPDDFCPGDEGGIWLTKEGKRKFFAEYERKKRSPTTSPGEQGAISYWRAMEVQARTIAKVLTGEWSKYEPWVLK